MNEIAIAVTATLFAAVSGLVVHSSRKFLEARRTVKVEIRLPGDVVRTREFSRSGDDEELEKAVDDLLHSASSAPTVTTAG